MLLAAVCVYAGCVTLTSKTGSSERMQYATPRSASDYGASELWWDDNGKKVMPGNMGIERPD
jgi:hypothetical protein